MKRFDLRQSVLHYANEGKMLLKKLIMTLYNRVLVIKNSVNKAVYM